jgi:16S rRNA (guanine(527)-N(7))-methyltransferase RsmG
MKALLDWNEKINLTGAKDPKELALKHIADVWYAVNALGRPKPEIYDVGSGGGIPGIVLGVISPSVRVTLVERRQKKASVLHNIISELGLEKRVRVISRSFEEIGKYPEEAEYWFRGFLPGPKLATYFSRFFPEAQLGQLVLMKGPAWSQEKLEILKTPKIRDAWIERFSAAAEIEYDLPCEAGRRVLALV